MVTAKYAILATMVIFTSTGWAQATLECQLFTVGTKPDYEVRCQPNADDAMLCQVDANTFAGWQNYVKACTSCHGAYAKSLPGLPSLLELVKTEEGYTRFVAKLHHGHLGSVPVMPSWQDNCDILPDIDNIYRYVKARADSQLPTGSPADSE